MNRIDPSEYRRSFGFDSKSSKKQKAALARAWETRNCEIELYWKRAAYFWTMIAVLFAAYGVALKDGDIRELSLAIACVGLVLSVGWYLINRASAAWQKNWEAHVDALEDDVTGPLYKTVRCTSDYKILDLTGPLPFSPSRISILISLFISGLWFALVVFEAMSIWLPAYSGISAKGILALLTVVFTVASLLGLMGCRTSTKSDIIRFKKRESHHH